MDIRDQSYSCVTTSSIWQFAGYILFAIKIVVPLIIIILGIIDFFKAITSAKDDAINSAAKNLIFRLVIGLVIFFVPLIVNTVFKFIKEANSYVAAADACQTCLLQPFNSSCNNYKATAKANRDANKQTSTNNYKVTK